MHAKSGLPNRQYTGEQPEKKQQEQQQQQQVERNRWKQQ